VAETFELGDEAFGGAFGVEAGVVVAAGVGVDRRLPADSSLPGQTPAQEAW
jgi:hypothetical protein